MAIPLPAGGEAGFGDVDAGKFYTEPVRWMVTTTDLRLVDDVH